MDDLNAFLESEVVDINQLAGALDFLKEYSLIHFDYEKNYQAIHNYPDLHDHKKLHK